MTVGWGTRSVLLLLAVTCRGWLSWPPAVMLASWIVCRGASSSIVVVLMPLSVGGTLAWATLTMKMRVVLTLSPVVASWLSAPASVTVTVMVAVPEASATGVYLSEPVAWPSV